LWGSESEGEAAGHACSGRHAVVRAGAELTPAFRGGASVPAHHIRARTCEPDHIAIAGNALIVKAG